MTAAGDRSADPGWPAILATAFLLCLAAVWNGQPFLYPDTPTYLRGAEMGASRAFGQNRPAPWLPPASAAATAEATSPTQAQAGGASPPSAAPSSGTVPAVKALTSVEDKVVLAGRSVYYGALLYASHLAGSLWFTVVAQALCVAWLLHLLMVRLWGLGARHLLGTVAVLAALSPLAVYTGFLMPDIFGALGLAAMAALAVYWDRLTRGQRTGLALLLLFGLVGHASHVAIAAALLVLALLARALGARWRRLAPGALAVVALCIAGAVAAEWAFGKAVTKAIGAPPLRLPHPMARLIDMGPGTDYLRQSCPQSGFAACEFVRNYPTAWTDFLFSPDPAKGAFSLADPAAKRRLADEQGRFVLAVLRHDPAGVLRGVGAEVLRQFGEFRVDIWGFGERELAMYEGRVPDDVYAGLQASRGAFTPVYNQWFSAATYTSVAAALLVALWWRRRGAQQAWPAAAGNAPRDDAQRFSDFAWAVIAGVAANAVVCAGLASSLDRFQARVVWLLPFLALSALCLALAARHRRSGAGAAAPTASSLSSSSASSMPSVATPSATSPLQGSAP